MSNEPTIATARRRVHGRCWVCGKKGSYERTFPLTVSPFVRFTDGRAATEELATEYVNQVADEWEQRKHCHPGCEEKALDMLLDALEKLEAGLQERDARIAELEARLR